MNFFKYGEDITHGKSNRWYVCIDLLMAYGRTKNYT